jgi:hypothetical protein
MEQDQNTSLFTLSVDHGTKSHLSETAKWARFLAIAGMIFLGFAVVAVLFFSYYISTLYGSMGDGYSGGGGMYGTGFGVGIAMFYIFIIAVWFFPLMYLLRFANRMKNAIAGNDQQALNIAFQNLKICFRFVGIVTIIVLALYAIAFIFGIISFAAFS